MNETMKTILSRRSIRAYKSQQITEDELQNILNAGKFAASAMNQQSWHFTVVQNKDIQHKINEACRKVMLQSENPAHQERAKSEKFDVFYDAPTIIIVSGDEKAIAPQNDCSLAIGNMFLAAESMDIGSCWIHAVRYLFAPENDVGLKRELEIPEGYTVVGSGIFGYKAMETPTAPERKENTVNIIR